MNRNPDKHYKSGTVAADYDASRFSSIPARVFNFFEKRTVVRYFSRRPKGSTIGEAPCGTGRLAGWRLKAGYRIHGFDIFEAMLGVARQRLGSLGKTFTCEVENLRNTRRADPSVVVRCAHGC